MKLRQKQLSRIALLSAILLSSLARCSGPDDGQDMGKQDAAGIPAGIDVRRELMITSTTVVGDPVRTHGMGVWTFGWLMQQLAPQGMDASDFVEKWLLLWTSTQTINGFSVAARPAASKIISAWPRRADGKLDLAQAPFRLLAIVNRMDLRQQEASHGLPRGAGEGRFVFGMLADGEAVPFTLIFEFGLTAAETSDAQSWACQWHQQGSIPLGESYNTSLQTITDRFSKRGSVPTGVNGSALHQIRTNEVNFTQTSWELREFNLDPMTGMLRQVPLDRTPDESFLGSSRLASFLMEHRDDILSDSHDVSATYQGAPFQGSTTHIPHHSFTFGWSTPDGSRIDPLVRHRFSLNTCNGCHGGETKTLFTHVSYDHPIGQEARLSGFLTGITLADPISNEQRTFNELFRRAEYLRSLLACGI